MELSAHLGDIKALPRVPVRPATLVVLVQALLEFLGAERREDAAEQVVSLRVATPGLRAAVQAAEAQDHGLWGAGKGRL